MIWTIAFLIAIPAFYFEKQINTLQDSIDSIAYDVKNIEERLKKRGFLLDDERPPEI